MCELLVSCKNVGGLVALRLESNVVKHAVFEGHLVSQLQYEYTLEMHALTHGARRDGDGSLISRSESFKRHDFLSDCFLILCFQIWFWEKKFSMPSTTLSFSTLQQ